MSQRRVKVPLNRVEGDLEISVEIEQQQVVSAQVHGTMFRGFEQMMLNRAPLDGLVITPRICGICSTSHLYAAALALDNLYYAQVPDNAVRIRNLAQIAEHIQSDLRHAILMFAVDFAHNGYENRGFFAEARRRYAPLQGSSAIATIHATKKILEVVAILGGQWPHSSFMVPGGVVSTPSKADLRTCRLLFGETRRWYETQILGGPLEAWRQVQNSNDLLDWCQDPSHRHADLAQILSIGRSLELERGTLDHHMISAGSLPLPSEEAKNGRQHLLTAGYWNQGAHSSFDIASIQEDDQSSFFRSLSAKQGKIFDYDFAPDIDKPQAYSWVKSPQYLGSPAETGPLAEMLCDQHALITDWVNNFGVSPLARELARLLRPAELLPVAERWLRQTDPEQACYHEPRNKSNGRGIGLVQASRGTLGHWVEILDDHISCYQIISPTSWNAAPRNRKQEPGPIEAALLGARVEDEQNPLELGHIVRSFDPCLVCAVHTLHRQGQGQLRIGCI